MSRYYLTIIKFLSQTGSLKKDLENRMGNSVMKIYSIETNLVRNVKRSLLLKLMLLIIGNGPVLIIEFTMFTTIRLQMRMVHHL